MIRLIYCVNRRDDVSLEDFRQFWNSESYGKLYDEYKKLFNTFRFKKSLVLKVPMNIAILNIRGTRKPYDGVIEMWWNNARELLAVHDTQEAETLRQEIAAYEEQFVDRSRSTLFFSEYSE